MSLGPTNSPTRTAFKASAWTRWSGALHQGPETSSPAMGETVFTSEVLVVKYRAITLEQTSPVLCLWVTTATVSLPARMHWSAALFLRSAISSPQTEVLQTLETLRSVTTTPAPRRLCRETTSALT